MYKGMSTRYLRWLGNLVIMLSSIMITFLVLEFILAMFLPQPIVWLYPQDSYVHDDGLIHKLRPNQKSFTHSFPVETNFYGLRDYEFSLKPSSNIFRILCLGDSLTFGNGVRLQDTYPKRLEAILNPDGQHKYEVINAGVPAYDTWQEVAYFRQHGWQFDPKLVIIGFYINDIVPKPKVIPRMIDASGHVNKYGLERLISDKIAYLLKRSRVLLLARDRYRKLRNQIHPSTAFSHEFSLLHGTFNPFVEAGWNEVEASLKEMSALRNMYDFQLLLVFFPMPDQLIKNYQNATYPSRLKEISHKYDIDFLDLMPVLSKSFHGFGSLFIEWDGHPNAMAYDIAAREIKQYLLTSNMLPDDK